MGEPLAVIVVVYLLGLFLALFLVPLTDSNVCDDKSDYWTCFPFAVLWPLTLTVVMVWCSFVLPFKLGVKAAECLELRKNRKYEERLKEIKELTKTEFEELNKTKEIEE